MPYIALNNAYSTLASGIAAGATVINVQTGHGARFAVGSDYSYVTLEDAAGHIEICKLIGQTGDALTVVRGQDGTTARSWVSGDVIDSRPCAAAINDLAVSSLTHSASTKAVPADSDELPLVDSAASFGLKKVLWSAIKTALQAVTWNNATNASNVPWAGVSGKPSTASGYGISDAITTGNIGSQSVLYANSSGSAGNADTLDGNHASAFAAAGHSHSGLITSVGSVGSGIGLGYDVSGTTLRTKSIVAGVTTTSGSPTGVYVTEISGTIYVSYNQYYSGGGGGACLHPHASALRADGSPISVCDIRPGDVVRGPSGRVEVLGVWQSRIQERKFVAINGTVPVTPGHLIPLADGRMAAFDVGEYEQKDRAKTYSIKTTAGMQRIGSPDMDGVVRLEIGQAVITPSGTDVVRSLEEFEAANEYLPVFSVATVNGEPFFADGIAVAALNASE